MKPSGGKITTKTIRFAPHLSPPNISIKRWENSVKISVNCTNLLFSDYKTPQCSSCLWFTPSRFWFSRSDLTKFDCISVQSPPCSATSTLQRSAFFPIWAPLLPEKASEHPPPISPNWSSLKKRSKQVKPRSRWNAGVASGLHSWNPRTMMEGGVSRGSQDGRTNWRSVICKATFRWARKTP